MESIPKEWEQPAGTLAGPGASTQGGAPEREHTGLVPHGEGSTAESQPSTTDNAHTVATREDPRVGRDRDLPSGAHALSPTATESATPKLPPGDLDSVTPAPKHRFGATSPETMKFGAGAAAGFRFGALDVPQRVSPAKSPQKRAVLKDEIASGGDEPTPTPSNASTAAAPSGTSASTASGKAYHSGLKSKGAVSRAAGAATSRHAQPARRALPHAMCTANTVRQKQVQIFLKLEPLSSLGVGPTKVGRRNFTWSVELPRQPWHWESFVDGTRRVESQWGFMKVDMNRQALTTVRVEKTSFRTLSATPCALHYTLKVLRRLLPLETFQGLKEGVYDEHFSAKISADRFAKCELLTSFEIPYAVTKIGARAFTHCVSLKRIAVPPRVAQVQDAAFCGCASLKSAVFTGGCSLGTSVFAGCESLVSVTLPESLEVIPRHSFSECAELKTVRLPESVRVIGANAFANCKRLATINIPKGVVEIHDRAFFKCEVLNHITLPPGLKAVNVQCFQKCRALEHIVIPEGVVRILDYAFFSCENLAQVQLPQTLQSIAIGAFQGCQALTRVALPMEGGLTVTYHAFRGCYALAEVILPPGYGPEMLGKDVFADCPELVQFCHRCQDRSRKHSKNLEDSSRLSSYEADYEVKQW